MRGRYVVCGVVVAASFILGACATDDASPTGPSKVSEPTPFFAEPTVPDGGGDSTAISNETRPKGCDVLKVTARRVVEVGEDSVTILVTVDYDGDGEPYVKVVDRATGREIIRKASPGGITVGPLAPGSYDYQVFVEVNESRGFFQCDGGVTFEILPPEPPKPPKCRQGSSSRLRYEVTDSHITAGYKVRDEGAWSLTLYAGHIENPRRYRKRYDATELACGETDDLSIRYQHRYHGACLWTLVAEGPGQNGQPVVVLNRCNQDN